MASIARYDANYRNQLQLSMAEDTDRASTGSLIANTMAQRESEMLQALADVGKASGAEELSKAEAKVTAAQEKYRSASRMYEMFEQLVKNADEIMRRVISNLSLR